MPFHPDDLASADPRQFAAMEFLAELARVIASSTDLQPILDWIVHKTTAMLGADEGSVRLLGNEPSPTLKTLIRSASNDIASGSWPREISASVMGYLGTTDEPLATPDLIADSRFSSIRNRETRVRAALAVSLRVENRLIGMLAVTQATPGRVWTRDEIQLISIVAVHSAGAIEQARLRVEAEEKQRLEERLSREQRDLERARDIQTRLLPSAPLRAGAWEAGGRVVPMRQVGGDAFDAYALDDGRFTVAIGDVSGHGVPASLLMAMFQALLRAHCDGQRPLAEAIALVNQAITRTTADGQFITAFCAEVDPHRGVLRFVNAGHNPPLLRRAGGEILELGDSELTLGVMSDFAYTAHEVPFAPGDSILLYSDGVTEAFNRRDEMFGMTRLRDAWGRLAGRTSTETLVAIFAEVDAFRGLAEPQDDMTLVAVCGAR